ncbi:unnamed protein product [Didymodactylos carnosus]|uniref:Uncharacterized protein n=1 Tax=Didymodactylos carnosus TaxID=1234261 RepID=A0A814AC31_9BILA|nr:unnamed protein product [Didymodactylos carnosus]CAF3691098.1 unnamed protein product [Didymodactylos carnosus]
MVLKLASGNYTVQIGRAYNATWVADAIDENGNPVELNIEGDPKKNLTPVIQFTEGSIPPKSRQLMGKQEKYVLGTFRKFNAVS